MAISTNSIIHYTDTVEKLKSILENGFAIKYCAEKLEIDDTTQSLAAHPMISFCDIPLSQAYRHFDAYGRYGIGLTKEWANSIGINPVLYLERNSSISKTLGQLIKERRKSASNFTSEQKNQILRIKCFAKNYSGPLKRKNIDENNYRFYDEREWRLVPETSELKGASFSIDLTSYNKNKDVYNDKISALRFGFKAKDISYIIVNKTKEIPAIINVIRSSYSNKCTAAELDILFSKICSTEQIVADY